VEGQTQFPLINSSKLSKTSYQNSGILHLQLNITPTEIMIPNPATTEWNNLKKWILNKQTVINRTTSLQTGKIATPNPFTYFNFFFIFFLDFWNICVEGVRFQLVLE
jgi:hypothetical protein